MVDCVVIRNVVCGGSVGATVDVFTLVVASEGGIENVSVGVLVVCERVHVVQTKRIKHKTQNFELEFSSASRSNNTILRML